MSAVLRTCLGLVFLIFSTASLAEAHLVIKDSALFSGLLNPWSHTASFLSLLAFSVWTGQWMAKGASSHSKMLLWFDALRLLTTMKKRRTTLSERSESKGYHKKGSQNTPDVNPGMEPVRSTEGRITKKIRDHGCQSVEIQFFGCSLLLGTVMAWICPGGCWENALQIVTFILGLLIAASFPCSSFCFVFIGIFYGLVFGAANMSDMELTFKKYLFFAAGLMISINAFVCLIAFLIGRIKNRIFEIGIRILGSWIAAATAMMLAYSSIR